MFILTNIIYIDSCTNDTSFAESSNIILRDESIYSQHDICKAKDERFFKDERVFCDFHSTDERLIDELKHHQDEIV